MKKKAISLLLLPSIFFCLTLKSSAQTNISGIINIYTDVVSVPPCANQLVVGNSAGFNIGDLVLLIQMKGATIDITNTAAFGTITSYNSSGLYEAAYISDVQGNTISFSKDLVNSYNIPNGLVQMVSVPQYGNVNVNGLLSCADWNGSTGGVLAFVATGTVTLNSTIDVSGKGFLGGANTQVCPNSCNFSQNNSDYFYSTGSYRGAFKGEGIAAAIATMELGRGAQANGGGGGNDHNNGGAGGGGYSTGGLGGNNNEPGAFNCKGFSNFGRSGLALTFGANKLFLGGGGGAGHGNNGATGGCPNNGNSGFGGDGGGLVIIGCLSFDGNGQTIKANGLDGQFANGDGGGGGGSGGVVCLNTIAFTPNPLSIEVKGGIGGNASGFGGNRCYGPGGGGAGGLVKSPAALPGSVTVIATGGVPGIVTSSSNPCNGTSTTATAGTAGGSLASFVLPAGTVDPSPGCGPAPLPVGMISFTGKQINSDVQLDWMTTPELNASSFEIEKSFDQRSIHSIGSVKADQNATANSEYSFTDPSPFKGSQYYRLKLHNSNGGFSYSKWVEVYFHTDKGVLSKAWPNPVGEGNYLNIGLLVSTDDMFHFEMIDAMGKTVKSWDVFSSESVAELDIDGIANGVYFLTLITSKGMEAIKVSLTR